MGADIGRTILYGVAISIPIAVVSGIFYGKWIAKRISVGVPEIASAAPPTEKGNAPPVWMVILLLLPVALIFGAALATMVNMPMRGVAVFLGHPFTALTIAALASLYLFALRRGVSRERAMKMAADSLAPMGALLCIMGGGGAFKQVIVDSGVGAVAGRLLVTSSVSPLLVVFVIAMVLRVAMGSATVGIISAAGIVAPIVKGIPGYSPEIIVLALCCGGSGPSHVNDSGFWLVNQYFGMTVPQTLRSWTAMKMVGAFTGILIVLAAHALLR
jgi:H+/gluconate symporter-like permease